MCFSAGASFTGGAFLFAMGTATLRETHDPSQKLFSAIPMLFAFQQFAEGVIWLTLKSGGNDQVQTAAMYLFLITALIIWPVMMPMSLMLMEKNEKKKKLITSILSAGILVAVYYAYCLLTFSIAPRINEFHIQYAGNFPRTGGNLIFIFYLIATVAPLFVSSVRRMKLFGVLIALSCLVTGVFYREYLTSVWCFFAAIISCIIYVIIRESQREGKAELLLEKVK